MFSLYRSNNEFPFLMMFGFFAGFGGGRDLEKKPWARCVTRMTLSYYVTNITINNGIRPLRWLFIWCITHGVCLTAVKGAAAHPVNV
jgi:hypothetical protein